MLQLERFRVYAYALGIAGVFVWTNATGLIHFTLPVLGALGFATVSGAALVFHLDRTRRSGEAGPLPGVTSVPLNLEHPYLQVRAAVTEGGRVTILVDGVAKDLALAARPGHGIAGIEQKTGDATFDARVRVTGNNLTCRSLLDGVTRQALREALDAFPGLTVSSGVLQWNGRPASVEDAAKQLLDVATRLISPDLLAGLEKSALTDTSPVMRHRALDLVIARFPTAPEARRIAAAALADKEPAVRLRAAVFLGPEGHDEVAALAASESLAPELRAEALRGTAQLPRERAAPIVREALTDRRELVRMSAIVTVARLKLHSCNDRLAVIVRRATPLQQLAIVEAVALTGHESGEAPLLAALEDGTPEAKLAAVRALGPLGSVRSVEPLLQLRGTAIMSGEIGPAAGAAVAAIQSRLAGAGAGQLAIAESPANGGAISFPDAERGALSVPRSEPGELALTEEEVSGAASPRNAARRRTT